MKIVKLLFVLLSLCGLACAQHASGSALTTTVQSTLSFQWKIEQLKYVGAVSTMLPENGVLSPNIRFWLGCTRYSSAQYFYLYVGFFNETTESVSFNYDFAVGSSTDRSESKCIEEKCISEYYSKSNGDWSNDCDNKGSCRYRRTNRYLQLNHNIIDRYLEEDGSILVNVNITIVSAVNTKKDIDIRVPTLGDTTTRAARLLERDIIMSKTSFKTTDDIIVPISRAVLAIESDKLFALFTQGNETMVNGELIININGTKECLDSVLNTVYTPSTSMPDDQIEDALRLAEELGLTRSKAIAELNMSKKVSIENALEMYTKACQLNAKQLVEYVIDFVRVRGPTIEQTQWKQLTAALKPCDQL
jgi:hypothetical protein